MQNYNEREPKKKKKEKKEGRKKKGKKKNEMFLDTGKKRGNNALQEQTSMHALFVRIFGWYCWTTTRKRRASFSM